MKAYIFPGQGAQFPGMGKDLYEQSDKARELFEKFGVATSQGRVASTADEALEIARGIKGQAMVKAQIHAGGRGKGTFKNGFKGGVHLAKTPEEARDIAAKMLGQVLVTHQTGPEGKLVSKVLIAEAIDIIPLAPTRSV